MSKLWIERCITPAHLSSQQDLEVVAIRQDSPRTRVAFVDSGSAAVPRYACPLRFVLQCPVGEVCLEDFGGIDPHGRTVQIVSLVERQ